MRHNHRLFGRVQHTSRRILTRDFTTITGFRDLVHIGAGRVHLGVHVSDLALHQLEFTDGLSELLAL